MKYILFLFFCFTQGGFSQNETSNYLQDLETFRQKNYQLKASEARLNASSDFLLSKKLFWTPAISLGAIKSHTETRIKNPNANYDETSKSDSNYATLSASLNIFKGGADITALSHANALLNSETNALKNEELNVELNASNAIFKDLYLRETMRIQENIFQLKQQALKIISSRYSQGKTSQQEVIKAEVDLAQQKNKLRLSEIDLQENQMAIQSLFVDKLKTQDWPYSEKNTLIFSENNDALSWPLVAEKHWRFLASESSLNISKLSFLPTVDFSFQLQRSPIKTLTGQQWVSLLELKFPIWSRMETRAQVADAQASLLNSEAKFKSNEQAAKLKNDFLRKKIKLARTNLTEAKKNAEVASSLYQDLLRSFSLGRISMNDLFIEQERLLTSESNLNLSLLNYHQTIVELCVLYGKKMSDCAK